MQGVPLVVIGMHRSGTSAVARCIASMGIPPAKWCLESRAPNDHNPTGFYEPRPLVWENERLLNSMDGSWSAPPPEISRPRTGPEFLSTRSRSHRVFRRCARTSETWFWKDPRLSLLLPYWRSLLSAGGAPELQGAVVVVRNPRAVAQSLNRRDGIATEHAFDLWMLYNASAVHAVQGLPTFVVDYDRIMDDSGPTIGALADWLSSIGLAPTRSDLAHGTMRSDLRRSSRGISIEPETVRASYETVLGLVGPYDSFPDVELRFDRNATFRRIAPMRRKQRPGWELRSRVDRRTLNSLRRFIYFTPAAMRELRSKNGIDESIEKA